VRGGVWDLAGRSRVQGGYAVFCSFVSIIGVSIHPCVCVYVMVMLRKALMPMAISPQGSSKTIGCSVSGYVGICFIDRGVLAL
jgi:hypothetical protein